MLNNKEIKSPYIKFGLNTNTMMYTLFLFLTIHALIYATKFHFDFLYRYFICILIGLSIETFYILLKNNKFSYFSPSNLVTSALLVLSLPVKMPLLHVGFGIFVSSFFGKLIVDKKSIRLNPMLLGRLFLMLFFANSIQTWNILNDNPDILTYATPLELYNSEGYIYSPLKLFLGSIEGTYDEYIGIIQGSPADALPILTIIFAIFLYLLGIIDFRLSTFFILGYLTTCYFLNMPVIFCFFSGSILFSSVYILTEPKTSPASKSGRIIAGLIAGIINALIRNHGFYPEGIVFSILIINFLSPSIDNLTFIFRSYMLSLKKF